MEFRKTMSKPLVNTQLATQFNMRVQMDLFFVFERTFVIMVDECIRYAVSAHLNNKSGEELCEAIFKSWIMYFGPMNTIAFDQ